MAEYIKRKALVDLVLGKLKFMGDARIMNNGDEKVLSEIDGYEKAIYAVHELLLDKDLIEDVQPVVHSKWTYGEDESGKDGIFCSNCKGFVPWDYEYYDSPDELISDNPICSHCGAYMKEE